MFFWLTFEQVVKLAKRPEIVRRNAFETVAFSLYEAIMFAIQEISHHHST